MSFMYDARDAAFKTPYGATPAGKPVILNLRPRRYFGVTEVDLFIAEDGNENEQHCVRGCWTGLDGAVDVYRCEFSIPRPGVYWYYFRVKSAKGVHYISRGYGAKGDAGAELASRFQLTAYDADYHTPDWFGKGITYNIFPDRFRRTRLPKTEEYRAERRLHVDWYSVPDFRPDKRGEILNNDFFGGSLRGVIAKLDHLAELHVSTIYLNPIFEAYSNHRYDTGDYKKIDPMLGTEEDFKELCAQAKERGMRIMLDGVFNHTGFDSRYFNGRGHYEELGAHQSKESPYYDWYDFSRWPDQYSSWWGIYTLPQVREESESYQKYMFEGKDSVIRRWLRLGASAWRLDVADELPDWFIQKLNAAAREEKEDAFILGEVWEDASNKIAYGERRRYFQGGELDSVMNYPLKDAIIAFLSGDVAEHFAEHIEILRENYPPEVFYSLMNVIGTHDTARILTMMGSDETDWKQDKEHRAAAHLRGKRLEKAKCRARMAAVLQFTMPGSPCIYYGDEAGMQGFEDPFNRRGYPWGKEDKETLAFYRTLCAARAESEALSGGTLRFLIADGGLLVFERETEEEWIIVAVNRAEDDLALIIPCVQAQDLLGGGVYADDTGDGTPVLLGAEQAMILDCGKKVQDGFYGNNAFTELQVRGANHEGSRGRSAIAQRTRSDS